MPRVRLASFVSFFVAPLRGVTRWPIISAASFDVMSFHHDSISFLLMVVKLSGSGCFGFGARLLASNSGRAGGGGAFGLLALGGFF